MLPIVAFVLFALGATCVGWRFGRSWGTAVSILYALPMLVYFFVSHTVALHAALMLVLVIACDVANATPRRFMIAAATLTAGVLGYRAYHHHAVDRELDDLIARYPIVSLSERLAWSREGANEPTAPDGKEEADLPPGVAWEAVDVVERAIGESDFIDHAVTWSSTKRQRSLAALLQAHESRVDEFLRAEGFGLARMPVVAARKDSIDLPNNDPIPLQCRRPDDVSVATIDDIRLPTAEARGNSATSMRASSRHDALEGDALDSDALGAAHRSGVVDFINPEGFGLAGYKRDQGVWQADLDRVIGFQPHAFRRMPEFPSTGSTRWQVQELQLVSLLKHRPAAAYVSENLPRMDELVKAKTRALDEFETSSLERLRAGEELVAERHGSQIRMLGAIRAVRQCLDCHHVRRGTLLGAFTYRLLPAATDKQTPVVANP